MSAIHGSTVNECQARASPKRMAGKHKLKMPVPLGPPHPNTRAAPALLPWGEP